MLKKQLFGYFSIIALAFLAVFSIAQALDYQDPNVGMVLGVSTPIFIQAVSSDAGVGGNTLTVPITTHAGNALVVYAQRAAVTSITDTAGDVFTKQGSGGVWTALNIGASNSILITYSVSSDPFNAAVLEYSGVVSVGNNTTSSGSGTTASISLTTQDTNNIVVAGFKNDGVPFTTASTGNLRDAYNNHNQGSFFVVAMDNAAVNPSSVTNSVNLPSTSWTAAAIELRSGTSSPTPTPTITPTPTPTAIPTPTPSPTPTVTPTPSGNNFYIAQSAAGSGNGSSCANALSITFFNTAGNWGVGIGKIGPGVIVHLCGTITGAAGTNGLITQGSGTAGNPVTILFEPGAIMQSPSWGTNDGTNPTGGAIGVNNDWIVVDGGTNGLIQNTLNGTPGAACPGGSCNLERLTAGIVVTQSSNVEIKNMTIRNLYTKTPCSTDSGVDAYGVFLVQTTSNGMSNISLHDSMLTDMEGGFSGGYTSWSNISVYNNTMSRMNIEIGMGDRNNNSSISGLSIHNNNLFDNYVWWDTGDNNHLNGMHPFAVHTGSIITGLAIYNNYVHGDFGNQHCGANGHETASIFVEGAGGAGISGNVYNNLLVADGTGDYPAQAFLAVYPSAANATMGVYNNTIVGNAVKGGIAIGNGNSGTVVVKNNIVSNVDYFLAEDSTLSLTSDNNIFYNINNAVYYNSAPKSVAQWQGLGFDAHSSTSNPNLNSLYVPQSGSPAISAGANLTSLGIAALNSDKAGVARPSSGAWDIGAYYVGGSVGASGNIYIAQSAAGSNNGSSCSNSYAVSFFNTTANWGSGAGKIGPGTIVHICGTISGALSTNGLVTQGDGAAGNPITILFEPNAVLTSPAWGTFSTNPTGGAIVVQNNYITVDGGTNGTIQNTANGTVSGNSRPSSGIYIANVSHVVVKNLTIANIYVRSACSSASGEPATFGVLVTQTASGAMTDFTVDHVIAHDAGNVLAVSAGGSTGVSNITFSNNTLSHASAEIVGAAGGGSGIISNFTIFGNDISDNYFWWDTGDTDHLNGMHLFAAGGPGAQLSNANIYNNYIHGDFGSNTCGATGHETSHIYVEATGGGTVSGTKIYNNVLTSSAGDEPAGGWIGVGDPNAVGTQVYNNTIVGGSPGLGIGMLMQGSFTAKNNLLSTMGYYIYANGAGQSQVTTSDNNLFNNSSVGFRLGNTFYTFAQWKVLGFDAHGVNSSPNLTASFIPQSGSPAISAGANLTSLNIASLNTDKAGVVRPSSGAWDIGAYYVGGGLATPLAGDLNLDHIVNSLDYSIMNAHWLQNYPQADINSDGLVNSIDFAVLKSNWGKTW